MVTLRLCISASDIVPRQDQSASSRLGSGEVGVEINSIAIALVSRSKDWRIKIRSDRDKQAFVVWRFVQDGGLGIRIGLGSRGMTNGCSRFRSGVRRGKWVLCNARPTSSCDIRVPTSFLACDF